MLPGNAACESDVAHECNEQEQTQFPGHKAQIQRCTQGHFKKLISIGNMLNLVQTFGNPYIPLCRT